MSTATVLGLQVEQRDARLATVQDRLRSSLWLVPLVFLTVVVVVERVALRFDDSTDTAGLPLVTFVDDASSASLLLTTIASAMLTCLGVVFPLTIVALQLASSQFSPRVMRTFLRDRITQATFAAFVATFVYALLVLRHIHPGQGGSPDEVPALAVNITIGWVWLSLFWFIVFVNHIVHSIRVVHLIETVAAESRSAIEANRPQRAAYVEADAPDLTNPTAVVSFCGQSATIGGVETDRLIALATEGGSVFRLRMRVGDYVPTGSPLVEVFGGTPPDPHEVLRCFELGNERTMYQDVSFGLRQLVDIASRALSPAVNDPTTAVQVLDRLEDLLRRMADRPDPSGIYVDTSGVVRLVRPMPTFAELVDLAFTEIRLYGADAVQVCRRMRTALLALSNCASDDHATVIADHLARLDRAIDRSFADPDDRVLARTPERTGMG